MDVLYFLKERTNFIRRFYETASAPFSEIFRKIDAEEAPFDYDEHWSGNGPPFEVEWYQADLSLQILGQTCVSMLSEAIKLYFQTWQSELQIKMESKERDRHFKGRAFVLGYRDLLAERLCIPWDDCPADFDLLEQITLARNAAQHPNSITTLQARHDTKSRRRFPSPFFISDVEKNMLTVDMPFTKWFAPNIDVPADKLMAAIDHVELLADWLEVRLLAASRQ